MSQHNRTHKHIIRVSQQKHNSDGSISDRNLQLIMRKKSLSWKILFISWKFEAYINFDSYIGSLPLPWSIRMKVALGAAQGLSFLHEEAERPVIYRDFKTSNILLDSVSIESLNLFHCASHDSHSCILFIRVNVALAGIQCKALRFWACQRWSCR